MSASEAGLDPAQLSFTHTWLEGRTYRVSFESKTTNPIRHQRYFDEFDCSCVPDERPGRRWEATIRLRDVECPVHCPDTSKVVRRRLEELARRLRRMTGSAREFVDQLSSNLYQKQQVTYSNGVVSADPVAAPERAREARDATREAWDRMQEVSGRNARPAGSGPTASSSPAADPPETSTQIAFVEVD